ncbi:MAG TPA: hypothetical protein VIN75_05710 [Burkholderiaceae bacterium]
MLGDLCVVEWAYGYLGAQMQAPLPAWKPGTLHRAGESRPPLPVALHDARVDIQGKLGSWARLIAEEANMRGPADNTVPAIALWLRAQLHWASDQSWVDSYAAELADLRKTAYGLAPWDRARQDLPLPCPARGCGMLSLSWYSGSETVVCRSRLCGHRMTVGDYVAAVMAEWERQTAAREMATT